MKTLEQLPGVEQESTFRFTDAANKPAQCELLVSRSRKWAVATEQHYAGIAGPLAGSAPGLAAKVCEKYGIEPDELVLFTHYVYGSSYESWYVVRFAGGGRDLFEGIRFVGPSRELLTPEQAGELKAQLQDPTQLQLAWRAIATRR